MCKWKKTVLALLISSMLFSVTAMNAAADSYLSNEQNEYAINLEESLEISTDTFAAGDVSAYAEAAYEEIDMADADESSLSEEAILSDGEAQVVEIGVPVKYEQTMARNMLTKINDLRTGTDAWYWTKENEKQEVPGLQPLIYDYELEKIAMQRAAELALTLSYTRPGGQERGSIYKEFSYSCSRAGECYTAGQKTMEEAFASWEEAGRDYSGQSHRRSMLNGDFNLVAVGCVYYNGVYYWVQELASAKRTETIPTTASDAETTVDVSVDLNRTEQSIIIEKPVLNISKGKTAKLPQVDVFLDVKGNWPGKSCEVITPISYTVDPKLASITGNTVKGLETGKTEIKVRALDLEDKIQLNIGIIEMHRLYNPNSGEHFYTANTGEKDSLVKVGWQYEGVGWNAPEKNDRPVYRLYNENAGDHHYTCDAGEKNYLVKVGWNYEGIGWYSESDQGVPLYRQYNPNAVAGSHNYTTNKAENDMLVKLGWRAEGIGWYGVREK